MTFFGELTSSAFLNLSPILSDFEVEQEIGSGASGVVYGARCRTTDERHVVKIVSMEGLSVYERRHCKREIEALKSVNHPNIVLHHASDMTTSHCIIVMERCESTLETLIDNARSRGQYLPDEVLIEWMAELLSALRYLHLNGIVHRDIKTGNIFVSKKCHLKLGDFGVCTITGETHTDDDAVPDSESKTFSFIGTPFYVAPEVCEGAEWTPQSDVWSLGVVLYELCTLGRPFVGDNVLRLVSEICDDPIPSFPPGRLKDSRFETIVMKMLDRNPQQRPTVDALLNRFFVLPKSHPSHPEMEPARARDVQAHHGPRLDIPLHALSPMASHSDARTRGWLTPRNLTTLRTVRHTHNGDAPLEGLRSERRPQKKYAMPAPKKRSFQDPNTPLHHSERYRQRIRNVKSTVNIAELRQKLRLPQAPDDEELTSENDATTSFGANTRRSLGVIVTPHGVYDMATDLDGTGTLKDEVTCEANNASPALMETQRSAHGEADKAATLRQAIETLLSERGDELSLNDLDELAQSLNRIKIRLFGLC